MSVEGTKIYNSDGKVVRISRASPMQELWDLIEDVNRKAELRKKWGYRCQ